LGGLRKHFREAELGYYGTVRKKTVTMKLTKKAAVKLFHHIPITYLLSTLTGLVKYGKWIQAFCAT